MAIATDALRMQLELDLVGVGAGLDAIKSMNAAIDAVNLKSQRQSESFDMQRLALEAKFNPEAQRELSVLRLNKEAKELNVSTDYYLARMQQINLEHSKAITLLRDSKLNTNTDAGSGVFDITKQLELQKRAAKELAESRIKAAEALDAMEMRRLQAEGRFSPDARREFELKSLIRLQDELNMSTETYRKMKQDIQSRYDQATAAPINQQVIDDQIAADTARAASRDRVMKEVAKIEEQELTNRQRYVARVRELQGQLRTGDITFDQANVLAGKAKADYQAIEDAETKKTKAKQDAIDKQENLNKFERTKQTDHYLKMKALRDKDAAEARNTIKMGAQEFAPMVDFNSIMNDNNKARRQAIALMNSYSSVADRAAADTLTFNAALANGTITAEEHARAIAGVDARMRSMAGGAGNMGYVIGNVMTGLEDFTTVLSITGFGMDGFAAATRSASNNVGQAVRGMGTASAAMMAPMVSIGMVLTGFAIPAIYKWITGVDEAASAENKLNRELERTIRLMTEMHKVSRLNLDIENSTIDIGRMFDMEAIDDKIESTKRAMQRLDNDMAETAKKITATTDDMWNRMVNPQAQQDFDVISAFLADKLGPNVGLMLQDRMKAVKDKFNTDVAEIGGEQARENLERNMKQIVDIISAKSGQLNAADLLAFSANQGTSFTAFTNAMDTGFDFVNDKAIIDSIQAADEKILDLNKQNTEEARKQSDELTKYKAELEALYDQRQLAEEKLQYDKEVQLEKEAEAREEAAYQDRIAMDAELEKLQLQSRRNRLLGDENEAERRLLDLSLRRKEIMESGLAAPDILEGMVNAELDAIAADIEQKLMKFQNITTQTDMKSQVQAYTDANKQALEANKDQKTEEKEMIELLKAIKDQRDGKAVLEFV